MCNKQMGLFIVQEEPKLVFGALFNHRTFYVKNE